jgi:hypothetical protein
MRSIEALLLVALAWSAGARAQQPVAAQGFAVERLYTSGPGAGWFVMDDLRLSGGLGGAAAVVLGYARRPLEVSSGGQRLGVVSDQAFAELGLAVTYSRFRFYLNFDGPIVFSGESGQIGGFQFTAPSTNVQQNPDTISDPRIGVDARLFGEADSSFRLGAGAQLIAPSGARADYLSDGDDRAMVRLLFAGDLGRYTWAGQAGVHLRPRDDGAVPGGPRGSELLFGLAGGAKFDGLAIGPEIYGESAFKSLFGAQTTGLEALLGVRFEGARADQVHYRFKLGVGGGLVPRFGAPEFRVVAGLRRSREMTRPCSRKEDRR